MKNLLLTLLFFPLVGFGQQCISGNCENGQGSFTWADGEKYVGEWKDGKKHGQGIYSYAVGDKYAGEWKDGNRHGIGTFTYANGTIVKGLFENGQYVGE